MTHDRLYLYEGCSKHGCKIGKVLNPSPGLLVITKNVQRRVTFAANGEVAYVETRGRRERSGGCLLSTWQKWCIRNHAAEEIPF